MEKFIEIHQVDLVGGQAALPGDSEDSCTRFAASTTSSANSRCEGQRLSDLTGPYSGTYRIVHRVLQPLLGWST